MRARVARDSAVPGLLPRGRALPAAFFACARGWFANACECEVLVGESARKGLVVRVRLAASGFFGLG